MQPCTANYFSTQVRSTGEYISKTSQFKHCILCHPNTIYNPGIGNPLATHYDGIMVVEFNVGSVWSTGIGLDDLVFRGIPPRVIRPKGIQNQKSSRSDVTEQAYVTGHTPRGLFPTLIAACRKIHISKNDLTCDPKGFLIMRGSRFYELWCINR
jgi:hypothetical protein